MQFKLSALSTVALAGLAVATPARRWDTEPASQCNTGDLQCCQSVQQANSAAASSLIALLGIVVQPITALVGLTCSPLTIIGTGTNSCSAQPVCCTNNSFNGLIAIGCTPVNVNL